MKKITKTICIALVILMSLSVITACSTPDTGAQGDTSASKEAAAAQEGSDAAAEAEPVGDYNPKDNPIATCNWIKSHPVVQIMIAGFMSRAQELGYEPLLFAPDEADAPKAYGLLEAGIAQFGVKGVAQHILDDSTAQYIKKLSDQGIAVVTGHTFIKPEEKENYPGLLAFAACSATDYGAAAAEEIGKEIGGKGTVAITCGSFNPTEQEASDSFKKTMSEKYPDVVVLEPIEEGFDTPTAIQRATAQIQSNPDLAGAFSTTGSGPATWAGAQKNTGKEICIISMDYARPNLDLVKSGEVHALVAQPLFEEWAMCADLLDTYLRGGEIEFENIMEAPLITSENVDDYYALVTKAEEAFQKIN